MPQAELMKRGEIKPPESCAQAVSSDSAMGNLEVVAIAFLALGTAFFTRNAALTAAVFASGMALSDLLYLRIPNLLNLLTAALGLAMAAWLYGWPGLLQSGLQLAAVLCVLFIAYLIGALGAGDVKSLAALAAFASGWHDALLFILLVAMAGGAQALALVLLNILMNSIRSVRQKGSSKGLRDGMAQLASFGFWCLSARRGTVRKSLGLKISIPYGLAIALGTWLWCFLGGVS